MNPISYMQPTVLLMIGAPGAGKSYFARRFSEKYNVPLISADRLRMEMFNEPQYTPAEQAIVDRLTGYMASELLRSKHTFIVDGLAGNVRSQRLGLERQARQHGFKVVTVWVQVDEASARTRSLKRNPKKVDDAYNRPMPENAFTGLLKQLTPPTTESYVVISGKHTFPAQRAAVVRKLSAETKRSLGNTVKRQEAHDDPASNPSSEGSTPKPPRPSDRPAQQYGRSLRSRPDRRRISISGM